MSDPSGSVMVGLGSAVLAQGDGDKVEYPSAASVVSFSLFGTVIELVYECSLKYNE